VKLRVCKRDDPEAAPANRRFAKVPRKTCVITGDLPAAPAYGHAMRRFVLFAAQLALLALPALAAPADTADTLTPDLRAALHCAAVLALTSAEQQRGNAAALALPALAERGKSYFAIIGARAMDEAGLTREAVRDLLADDVAELQRRTAAEPDQTLPMQARRCFVRLDAVVPPGS
jgi:hypothetical protein